MRLSILVAALLVSPLAPTAPSAWAQTPQTAEADRIERRVGGYGWLTNDQRRDHLTRELQAMGFDYEINRFEGGNRQTGPRAGANVVVTVGEGAQDIVLTAHFDAVTLADGTMSQGVVDNAGSVVALIEVLGLVAEQVAQAPQNERGPYRYVFVFTDQEELGLIGARKWLEGHDSSRIRAVINLDVNAYGETLMYGENVGEQSAFLLAAMRTQCAERAYDCMAYPVYPPSDDRVFSAAGLPVISIGTQDAVGAHQMWLAFNGGEQNGLAEGFVPPVFQRIHSAQDTMQWVDGDDIARTATFVADLALRLAGEE